MSLPIPLDVHLETGRTHRRVTRDVRNLSIRSTIPGGFASARLSLDRPLDVEPEEIAYYGTLTVTDGRNGGVVWQGRLEDPSRGVGSDGRIWELAAVGPAAHAEDRKVPLVYAYRDLAHWQHTAATQEKGRHQLDEQADEVPALLLHAPAGTSWTSDQSIRMTSRWILEASQNLGRVNWQMVGGSGDSDWAMEGYAWAGTSTQIRSATLTTAEQALSARVVGTDWTHPTQRLELRLRNINAEAGADNKWAKFWNIRIRSTLYDADGNELTSGSDYTADTVLASEIVTDLLGRLLNQFDGPTAVIDTTTTDIEQLAYPDGVTPAEVLRDLASYEPDHYWAAWERTVNDKARFEYVEWPTEVAYDADVSDGYQSTGSATDLYNEVHVRWRDPHGKIVTTKRTQTVPELDDAGLTRTALLDAGDNLAGVLAGAQTLGDNFLGEHATPRNAGSLTVARPILDHEQGRLIAPWEIRPGKLIRVRGVQPRVDALNTGGRDGVSVFRVVGAEFDTNSGAATLELDSRPLTVTHQLAGLIQTMAVRGVRRR